MTYSQYGIKYARVHVHELCMSYRRDKDEINTSEVLTMN